MTTLTKLKEKAILFEIVEVLFLYQENGLTLTYLSAKSLVLWLGCIMS